MESVNDLKSDILAKYPSVKSLSLWSRLVADLHGSYSTFTDSVQVGQRYSDRVAMTYTTIFYKNQYYFVKWDKIDSNKMPILIKMLFVFIGVFNWLAVFVSIFKHHNN